jgi:dTMP kinase
MGNMPAPEPSSTSPARGLFLTLDGPDGGGKTTQAARLAAWLRARGLEVVACRDPGGTALGDRLREILLDRSTVDLALRAEMLLYMASRAQLVEEVIRPALAAGRVVVSDRFLLANLAYQGDAGGLPVAEIGQVGRAATGGLLPDLTLILDVAPQVARARVGPARDRIEDRPDDYQARVRDGFLRAARAGGRPEYPAPVVVIDAAADPDAVFERIRSEVERALALGPRS